MNDVEGNVVWLLDKIHNLRTFNAVVDALADLQIENINDASEVEISEVLEKYCDKGVDVHVAHNAIALFYSRLFELGVTIDMVHFTHRGGTPYIVENF